MDRHGSPITGHQGSSALGGIGRKIASLEHVIGYRVCDKISVLLVNCGPANFRNLSYNCQKTVRKLSFANICHKSVIKLSNNCHKSVIFNSMS